MVDDNSRAAIVKRVEPIVWPHPLTVLLNLNYGDLSSRRSKRCRSPRQRAQAQA